MILKWQIQCTNDKTPIFYVVLSGLQIVYLKIGKCQWLYKTKWDQGFVCERVIFCLEMSPHIILWIFCFKEIGIDMVANSALQMEKKRDCKTFIQMG